MSLILSNLALGMAQALLFTFLAPLLTGLILQAGDVLRQRTGSGGRLEEAAGQAITAGSIYILLGRAWAQTGMVCSSCLAFSLTFLASSMLPGFLGAKISFGDSFIMLLLFSSGFLLTHSRGGRILTALFLLLAGAGFQHRGSMAPDLAFSFQGYYLTGAAFLAAAGAFCTVIWQLAGLRERLFTYVGIVDPAGEAPGPYGQQDASATKKNSSCAITTEQGTAVEAESKTIDLWLLLTEFLQAVFLLFVFARFFLPVELPSGPGVMLSAALCALTLGAERFFHAERRAVWRGAAVLFAILSLLAR